MTEEIKKNLSKCKYVYRIYKEHDNFHIEKYPIVYINSEFVYYKNGRKNQIGILNINSRWCYKKFKQSFDEALEYINSLYTDYSLVSVYFIEIDKLKEIDLSLIKQRLKTESKESRIKKQETEVKRIKQRYEYELRKLEEMKEQNKKNNFGEVYAKIR